MSLNTEYLETLITVLRTGNVKLYKTADLELEFHVEQPAKEPLAPSQLIEDKASEASLPPDLRTDNINSQDSILNWSAPPSADQTDETPLPLTGEDELI